MAYLFYCDTFCSCRTNIMDSTFTQVFYMKLLRFMLVHTQMIVKLLELLLTVCITVETFTKLFFFLFIKVVNCTV